MAMPAAGSPSRCFVAERADLVLARRALAGGARRKRREAGRRHRVSRGVALLASIGGPMTGRDDTSDAKRRLRSGGWYVRYTEWPSGHQVVLHRRSDTAVHLVTRWCPTEADAFEDVRAGEGLLQHAAVLVASLETSPACISEAFRIANRHGTHAILDVAPERKVPERLLRLANIAIVATRAARVVTGASVSGRRSALVAARSLLRRVNGGAVVLTDHRAALLLTRNDEIWIPAPHRDLTDTPEAKIGRAHV